MLGGASLLLGITTIVVRLTGTTGGWTDWTFRRAEFVTEPLVFSRLGLSSTEEQIPQPIENA